MIATKVLCEICGGELPPRSRARYLEACENHGTVLDDLAAAVWVQAYDAAWLGRDWAALEKYLAPDVMVMLAGLSTAIAGRPAVLAHMRALMTGTEVHEYNATDLTGYASGMIGVITYRWQLDWTVDHKRRANSGRDILVLREMHEGWQLVWRAQTRR